MGFEGKRVLITGASSGLGLAIAKRFLTEGAVVCGGGRREVCDLTAPAFTYLHGDITRPEAAEALVMESLKKMGGLDILVNCAGVTGVGGVLDTSPEEFRRQFEVNVFGLFYVKRAAVPALMDGDGSTIINVGSELGSRAKAGRIAYCPSKAAVEMLTRCLALECAPNVRVNGVLPGLMDTPMTHERFVSEEKRRKVGEGYLLKRMCQVEDVVEAVLFLSGKGSSFITGDLLAVCGGGQFYPTT